MSGEGHYASFRRTDETQEDNEDLCKMFERLILTSPVTKHMKFYPDSVGQVTLYEKDGSDTPQWLKERLEDGEFWFYISTYESWYEDADIYESEDREDSFVSIAKKFAVNNNLNME
jgi:hypothetical protein